MEDARSMVSAGCLFRGNYMLRDRAERLVTNLFCTLPEMRPKVWDFTEPARKPFEVADVVGGLVESPSPGFSNPFFLRRARPSFCAFVTLQNGPAIRPCHNALHIHFDSTWEKAEEYLPHLICSAPGVASPDYGYVATATRRDRERFADLMRPMIAAEMLADTGASPPFMVAPPVGRPKEGMLAWFHPESDSMRGPHGIVEDIVWFNYFGRPYVELIGKQRLKAAGWAGVDEVGDGLACYATERIDDTDSFDRRGRIRDALFEFVWTPGCKREDKRAPVFDFSEQIAAAPQTSAPALPPGARLVEFAGFDTEEERQQAIKAFEQQTGMIYDANTGLMIPRKG